MHFHAPDFFVLHNMNAIEFFAATNEKYKRTKKGHLLTQTAFSEVMNRLTNMNGLSIPQAFFNAYIGECSIQLSVGDQGKWFEDESK